MSTDRPRSTASRRLALAGIGAGVLGAVAARERTATAQSTPAAGVQHPLVGGWFDVDAATPDNLAYNLFHADGTVVIQSPYGGIGLGVWRPTGEDTAEYTVYFGDIDPNPTTYAFGRVTAVAQITLDPGGESYTAEFTVRGQAPDGTDLFAAGGTLNGTRLGFAPMATLSTPVARAATAPERT